MAMAIAAAVAIPVITTDALPIAAHYFCLRKGRMCNSKSLQFLKF